MEGNKDTAPKNISEEAIEEMVKSIEDTMEAYDKRAHQLDDQIFR